MFQINLRGVITPLIQAVIYYFYYYMVYYYCYLIFIIILRLYNSSYRANSIFSNKINVLKIFCVKMQLGASWYVLPRYTLNG